MARTIQVDYLARVEGEGALTIRLPARGEPQIEFRIWEPPRFFEALLRGRSQSEAPDITARICGICPIAYQMSACHAIEAAHGVTVSGSLRELRRLIYCGEWIESHGLHVYLLALPDFLGQPNGIVLAKDPRWGDLVRSGLRMKKAGNEIVAFLGGREIHPINARPGGFHSVPTRAELRKLEPELKWARDAALEAIGRLAELSFPELERDVELVALQHPDEYAMTEGRIVSSAGLDIAIAEHADYFVESQVPYSTALRSRIRGRGGYLCGPLARFNLNFDRLPKTVREAAAAAGFTPPCKNPFKSTLARAVEMAYAFEEALRIIGSYEPPAHPFVDVPRRAGVGHGCTEAPRGSLYHRYTIDEGGRIAEAEIVPPTSQNQQSIEDDLRALAPRLLALPRAQATLLAEQAVRSYDPCISCSTHFLTLRIERV